MAEEKEKLIIERARELFLLYGLKSVTMDDLSRELGMSKKTLYQYFTDKKNLIEKILNREIGRLIERFETLFDENKNALEILVNIQNEILNFVKRQPPNVKYDLRKYYPDLWEKIRSRQFDEMFKAIVKILKQGIKQGLFRKDLQPEIIAALQVKRSEILNTKEFEELTRNFSKEEILNQVFKYHIHGICSPKGIKVYNELLQQKTKN